jgi:putative Mg2+ transporter-C (MgtC) family protein
MGAGLYAAGALATALTLGVLSLFRYIELRFPTQMYARHSIQFTRGSAMSQSAVRQLLSEHGFKVSELSYSLQNGEDVVEYRMSIRTLHAGALDRLAETLGALPHVRGFTISPGGD